MKLTFVSRFGKAFTLEEDIEPETTSLLELYELWIKLGMQHLGDGVDECWCDLNLITLFK